MGEGHKDDDSFLLSVVKLTFVLRIELWSVLRMSA